MFRHWNEGHPPALVTPGQRQFTVVGEKGGDRRRTTKMLAVAGRSVPGVAATIPIATCQAKQSGYNRLGSGLTGAIN
jgi:hypothetical protein